MNERMTGYGRAGRFARSESPALWIALFAGLLILLAAAISRADSGAFSTTRTDRFTATLSPGTNLRVENVSGDVVATPGRSFSAVVTITVTAPTQERANEILAESRVAQSQDGADYSLETRWPDSRRSKGRRSSGDRRGRGGARGGCKKSARAAPVSSPGGPGMLSPAHGGGRGTKLQGTPPPHTR